LTKLLHRFHITITDKVINLIEMHSKNWKYFLDFAEKHGEFDYRLFLDTLKKKLQNFNSHPKTVELS
jgi:L-rhamnose mutarotase